ncbi:HNH endonuclease [Priestia abyssalis]|uniref:HNH endonuclease n=1 Tax=Priestia abyssalis TaxID=1221450 RepID=UPI0009956BD7|nr:HNH endonuclease signature motif containing protein [Priestia abyssalis]
MKLTNAYLYKQYIVEGLSVNQIAKNLGTTKSQVKSALRRHGIRKKPLLLGNQLYDNKEWLYEQYIVKKKGYTVIASELGVSYTTILDRILYFGWSLRGHKEIDKGAPRRGTKHTPESIEKIKSTRIKKRILTKCQYCGEKIERVFSAYKRSETNYCNQYCFRKYLEENRVETEDITDSAEYKHWRLKVYKRDGYRCKMPGCYSQSRDIAAHHIFPKKLYPEKQFDISNGITLCRKCHEKTYGKEEQFIEMLVRVIQTMSD